MQGEHTIIMHYIILHITQYLVNLTCTARKKPNEKKSEINERQ